MSEPFLGQISIFGFNFPPRGWAFCDGQLLPINQNQALFSLLGTTFGGDGRTTFALPDLRGRVPIHSGRGPGLTDRRLGSRSGAEGHSLAASELPSHRHQLACQTGVGSSETPATNVPAVESNMAIAVYGGTGDAAMNAGAVTTTGSSQAHETMQPFRTLSFAIATQGLFPSRN